MVANKTIKIEDIPNEMESFSDDALFNITSFGNDMMFRELISMYEEGDLEKPEMQRKYVWNKNEASRFIDSILLGLPVPSIFLAKTQDEKRLIVDGYQRIMTVFDYVKTGIFSGDGKVFSLSNAENINLKWRGKVFQELTNDEQRKIRNSSIHAIIFEQKQPQDDTGMYQIFERINTSGRVLKPQEIRNCVYHGEFNALLMELNRNKIWRKVLANDVEDSRMGDIELILRLFAFSFLKEQREITQRQINLVKYLNLFMGRNSNVDGTRADEFKKLFEEVIKYLYTKLGDKLFRNAKLKNNILDFSIKINPAILDSVFAATANYYFNHNPELQDDFDLINRYELLLVDASFQSAITYRTTNIQNIKTRIELASKILFGVEYEW